MEPGQRIVKTEQGGGEQGYMLKSKAEREVEKDKATGEKKECYGE